MKLIFAGTPEFAMQPLRAIVEAGYEVVGVITQEDKPQGRKNAGSFAGHTRVSACKNP